MTKLIIPRTATLIGLTAILMWSLLAVMTVATGTIPAFQLAAMTFAIGALVGSLSWVGRPEAIRALAQSPLAWIVGVGGLFGYHALYFLALRFAPPAEAGLLNYLWPLLIVLFSALLPGERLAPHHVVGAALGLGGTVLLFAGNRSGGFARSRGNITRAAFFTMIRSIITEGFDSASRSASSASERSGVRSGRSPFGGRLISSPSSVTSGTIFGLDQSVPRSTAPVNL